jgi:hypothetical protein
VPAPLRIALLTHEQLSPSFGSIAEPGWSVLRYRHGNAAPENFKALDELFTELLEES